MKLNIFKKALFITLLFSFAGCSNSRGGDDPVDPPDPPEEYTFEQVLSVESQSFFLESDQSETIEVNYQSLDKNYLKLELKTSVNLRGHFNYVNVNDVSESNSESFFVEASDEPQALTHFLDAFRPLVNTHPNCSLNSGAHKHYNIPMETKMALGAFSKEIISITLENVSSISGDVEIYGFYVSDREIPKEEVYISQGSLKAGIDLMGGGTLTYLERMNYQTSKNTYYIDEVLTPSNEVVVGVDVYPGDGLGYELGSKDHHVNLINYFDAGRQFQQSYYANIGGSRSAATGANGYTRQMCYTASSQGEYWPYNPVQGGDTHCNISQIVDYQKTDNSIYIKCKALDWANNNYVTDSYTENWYTIDNGVLFVKNRFIDFAGFTDMDKCSYTQLELPAAYVIHPLHNYVSYQGDTPWVNDEQGLSYQSDLGSWVKQAYIEYKHLEDWFAWVNDDDFGVGMYIPDIDYYASGRADASTNISYFENNNAYSSPMGNNDTFRYNKKKCTYSYQSCYTTNTCYTAPEINTTMLDYLPFEYTYALSVDYLPIIRNNFRNLYRKNAIDNDSMFIWDNELYNN